MSSEGPRGVSPSCLVQLAPSSQVQTLGPQTSSALRVVADITNTSRFVPKAPAQVTKPVLCQMPPAKQNTTQGRTLVLTVPRAANPQSLTVNPRLPQTTSTNIQIPPGMMLVRSEVGQLMLVSQQALLQVQQGTRSDSGQSPRVLAPQVSTSTAGNTSEKVTVIRMPAPPSLQPPVAQKTAVVKVISVPPKSATLQSSIHVTSAAGQSGHPRAQSGPPKTQSAAAAAHSGPAGIPATSTGVPSQGFTKVTPTPTFSQETLDSVKKCKNFLVTLMKLASSDSKSADLAKNVRGLVHKLLEGKLEAEEFTEELYKELNTTPQPCLVPFLKKSLPAVRILTADPQSFIQQAATNPTTIKPPSADAAQTPSTRFQKPTAVNPRPTQSRTFVYKSSPLCSTAKPFVLPTGSQFTVRPSLTHGNLQSTISTFKEGSASYKEDDDINDVASMAGVNLGEENARILTSVVGQVVQSCQDQPFLNPNAGLSRILHIGQQQGVNEVNPEVVSLISHATQEFLRGMLEKVTTVALHRKVAMKDDPLHAKVSDVRAQLRFLEEVEALKKRRNDEEEKEMLLRLARSRSNLVDPLQQQQLKQRAKELQQLEQAQLQKREANSTALAAIGPRKKRPLTLTETNQVSLLTRQSVPRVTRVVLKDLLLCMELDPFLRHSLTLYKAML
ncbi:transcription initiation factor TFIID subunit 4B isoform X2 [Synchiropus splendidus]|uniref:transcription initiation factor TFIID subunit 4B isoform X2 n=1 Tax=Synchiropus splendidus TaxID=270530 RepID=UPI00237D4264|nr:transcription initiation factor TFIID subunit 4B isoform X2 [Synchiropus splendidus]XP_053710212.1 transcription initiation factor TFIID subunit 4B isoform X2 [Synchiropus splendidus]